jgi:hypothetical protein
MKRELASKMYTPTTYFFGRFISNMIVQTAYPMIIILSMFWSVDGDTSLSNFGYLCAYGLMGNWIFACQGYIVGTACPQE